MPVTNFCRRFVVVFSVQDLTFCLQSFDVHYMRHPISSNSTVEFAEGWVTSICIAQEFTRAILLPVHLCKAIERVEGNLLTRIFAAISIEIAQLVYLNTPLAPETNIRIGILWGSHSCASKMSWKRAGCIELGLIAHSNGDARTRASISAFQTAFMFSLPNAIVKLSNTAVFISVLVLVVAKLLKHPIKRRLRCAWCPLVTGFCAPFGLPLVFVRLSSMTILAVHSPIPFSPPSLLLH
jgi:hypothetical protein